MVRAVEFARRPPVLQFLAKRAIRIFPLYWLVTLLLAGIYFASPRLLPSASYSVADVLRSLFLVPYLNAAGDYRPVVSQGWTLSYELFFYAFVGLGLVASLSRPVLCAAAFLAIAVVAAFFFERAKIPLELRYLLSPIAGEFLLGVLVGYFERQLPSRLRFAWVILGLLVSMCCVLVVINHPAEGTGVWRLLHWGVPAFAFVLSLLVVERGVGGSARSKLLTVAGDASYAIYLTHGIAFSVLHKLHPAVLSGGFAGKYLLVVFALVFGVLAHKVLEAPLQKVLLSTFVSRSRNKVKPQ